MLRLRVNIHGTIYAGQAQESEVSQSLSPGRFWVKPSWETHYWSFKVRSAVVTLGGAPGVFRFGELGNNRRFHRSTFSERWQFFACELLTLKVFGRTYALLSPDDKKYIRDRFAVLYSSHLFLNNKAGVDDTSNYVEGEVTDEPAKIDPFVCAGNTVHGEVVKDSRGRDYVKAECFYIDDDPPIATIEVLNDPRVLWATVERRAVGGLSVGPFPTLSGKDVPYPFLCRDGLHGFYPLNELRELKDGEEHSLYIPPR